MSNIEQSIDDLLGLATTPPNLDDLLGPSKTKTRRKKAAKPAAMTYKPLAPPRSVVAGGIWALREKKGRNLGKTCLICNKELKSRGGRPPVICPGKQSCFRAYRNAYRKDYDKARAS